MQQADHQQPQTPHVLLTVRQVFERVRDHLLKQGKAAYHPLHGCQYLVERADGPPLRCAVGCLFSDASPSEVARAEGVGVVSITVKDGRWIGRWARPTGERLAHLLTQAGVPVEAKELLERLQELHDQVDPSCWPARLERIEATLVPSTEVTP